MTGDIDFAKVALARLGKNTPGIDTFKNQKESLVSYLQKDALADQEQKSGTTWVWIYDEKIVLGYVTLAMYSIDRKDIRDNHDHDGGKRFPYSAIPALLIGQIATHRDYEDMGMDTLMVWWVVDTTVYLLEKVGCRMVALHPHEDIIRWYEKLKFKIINRESSRLSCIWAF